MPSQSPQSNSPSQTTSTTYMPPEHPVLTIDGERTLSQLEQTATFGRVSSKARDTPSIAQGVAAIQLGPANMLSPLARHLHSLKTGVGKRLSKLFKGNSKAKDVAAKTTLNDSVQCISTAIPEASIISVTLDPIPSGQSDGSAAEAKLSPQVVTDAATSSAIQQQPRLATTGSLRLDIFPENVATPALTADLPKPRARIDKTSQLVFCYSLLNKANSSQSTALECDDPQETALTATQREWIQFIDPVEQSHLRWLIGQVVKTFAEDPLKGPAAVAEILLVGPVLDRETYRSLLSCFISKFEQTTPLDLTLLQGLVQLVECASSGFLVDNDLVRIATVLSKELSITHTGTSNHPLYLTWALSRVLDVMVAGKVKNINRDRDHQPMLQLLDGLKDSGNNYLKYQATYAYQALQYAPDDETPLQTVWRYAQLAAAGASSVTSVFKLDPLGFLDGMEHLQQIGGGVADVIKAGVEGVKAGIEGARTLRQDTERVTRISEDKLDSHKKRSWYLALQGTALFIQQGRLSDFNQVVCQAPCHRDINFQWGTCRQLGEIAVDPLWDIRVRQQAIDFLGELYRSNTDWKPHADVKQWILTILMQISELSDPSLKGRVVVLLENLKRDGNAMFPDSYPLATRLPLPDSFPLLAQVQEIPKVEYALHTLKMQRLDEYKQAVYIAPMAKPSLQAFDDTLFPLMDKVQDFLKGDAQVMLILGDSGAGKSTFNRHLENKLWQDYNTGGRIPLFINLPALDRPDKDLIAEQLRIYRFSEAQIQELEQHRQFILICDGYDEGQLSLNLHTTNALNRSGQRNAKLLVTCRTQYLGPDYRDRFVPKVTGQYNRAANDLYQEAVIAPFSKSQIEDYVERHVPLESQSWVKKDYMDKLTSIPNLMDLAKNPFLLTLTLEALPIVVKGMSDLSGLRVTRVQLYDTFVEHWLGVNKRRLQDHKLTGDDQRAFEELLEDGFEQNGIKFQKNFAAAIFQEQEGRPIVDYIHKRDKSSWKAAFFSPDAETTLLRGASLLSRAGTRYRFVHRSVLEYFYSCTICGPSSNIDEFAPHDCFDSSGTSLSSGAHPLSQRNLVPEPSIVQFLSERVKLDPDFKYHLLGLIEVSKSNAQASQAAANAITILVKAGVHFNGADLQGIRIPGADLSGGQFDSAQLQGANLTDVNLTKSWIRQADFTNARMEGVHFGELPYLQEDDKALSCVYSPDGKALAIGLDNGDISIYNTATWTRTRILQGHQGHITGLAYSPSSHQLLSGGQDTTVRLWNCETGSPDFTLEEHTGTVTAVAFSPSGNQFASVSSDKTLRLWDARTGAAIFVLTGLTGSSCLSYTPDGRNISAVFASTDPIEDDSSPFSGVSVGLTIAFKRLRIVDTHTGLPGSTLKDRCGDVYCIAYSFDGQRTVTGDVWGYLELWETSADNTKFFWKGHRCSVSGVSFSPDGQFFASSSGDRTVKLWSAHSGALVSVFTGLIASFPGVVFSPSGSQMASSSDDKTVRIWELSSVGSSFDTDGQPDPVTSVAYSPDGQFLISGNKSGTIREHDAVTGESVGDFGRYNFRGAVYASYSTDGLRIAVTNTFEFVGILGAKDGVDDFILRGHTEEVMAVVFSPCGRWIATGGCDYTIRLWDACSGVPGLVFRGIKGEVTGLAYSPTGLEIASASRGGTIRVWEVESGESRVLADDEPEGRLAAVAYSPDGLQVVASCGDKAVRIWDVQDGKLRHNLQHDKDVKCFALSSCGQWIATGCEHEQNDQEMVLWNAVSVGASVEWRRIMIIQEFFGSSSGMAWRPRSLEFAIGDWDGYLRVWKVVQGSSEVSVQLAWTSGPAVLSATDTVITGATGLSTFNRRLLKQRGAINSSLP